MRGKIIQEAIGSRMGALNITAGSTWTAITSADFFDQTTDAALDDGLVCKYLIANRSTSGDDILISFAATDPSNDTACFNGNAAKDGLPLAGIEATTIRHKRGGSADISAKLIGYFDKVGV